MLKTFFEAQNYHFKYAVTGVISCTRCRLSVSAIEPTELPHFEEPLSNIDAHTGEPIKLTCVVKGLPKPDVAWYHLGR